MEKFARHEATRKALQLIESDGLYEVNEENIDEIKRSYPSPSGTQDWSDEADQYFEGVLNKRSGSVGGNIDLSRELGSDERQQKRLLRWRHQTKELGRFKGTGCDGIRPEHISTIQYNM